MLTSSRFFLPRKSSARGCPALSSSIPPAWKSLSTLLSDRWGWKLEPPLTSKPQHIRTSASIVEHRPVWPLICHLCPSWFFFLPLSVSFHKSHCPAYFVKDYSRRNTPPSSRNTGVGDINEELSNRIFSCFLHGLDSNNPFCPAHLFILFLLLGYPRAVSSCQKVLLFSHLPTREYFAAISQESINESKIFFSFIYLFIYFFIICSRDNFPLKDDTVRRSSSFDAWRISKWQCQCLLFIIVGTVTICVNGKIRRKQERKVWGKACQTDEEDEPDPQPRPEDDPREFAAGTAGPLEIPIGAPSAHAGFSSYC